MRDSNLLIQWEIVLFLTDFILITQQSIAGLTYHDDYDFEAKYRDLNECDPFYWHPLHLPDHCAEMLSSAIKSRVAASAKRSVRIMTRRGPDHGRSVRAKEKEDIYSLRRYYKYFEPDYEQPLYDNEYAYDDNEYSEERYDRPDPMNLHPFFSPYDKMLDNLRKDVNKHPIAPVVGMSNYGPVAMYQQPISRKSMKIINKVSRAYARAHKINNKQDKGDYYYGKIEFPPPNSTATNQDDRSDDIERFKTKNLKLRMPKKQKHVNGLMIQ